MDIKLDMECIQLMNFFEGFTGVKVKDCLVKDGCIYFVTYLNQASIAIGRDGRTVKEMERKLGKNIKIFEYSDDLVAFVRNLIPKAGDVRTGGSGDAVTVDVKVGKPDRYYVIGRDGRNLSIIKEILQRNSNVKELNIR